MAEDCSRAGQVYNLGRRVVTCLYNEGRPTYMSFKTYIIFIHEVDIFHVQISEALDQFGALFDQPSGVEFISL